MTDDRDPELTDLEARVLSALMWAHTEQVYGVTDDELTERVGCTAAELAAAQQRLQDLGFVSQDVRDRDPERPPYPLAQLIPDDCPGCGRPIGGFRWCRDCLAADCAGCGRRLVEGTRPCGW
jgi:hypothetical protein